MNELVGVAIHLNDTSSPHEPVEAERLDKLAKWLTFWKSTAERLENKAAIKAVGRLQRLIDQGDVEYRDLEYGLKALKDALDDAMEFQLAYRYPSANADVFIRWKDDWAATLHAFPAVVRDVRDGVDLWALGHGTASVFHMMRVLEAGLKKLADQMNVPFTIQTWHVVIDQIEAAIQRAQKELPKGEDRNDRLQFLSATAKEFRYFKDGWRNFVSHSKGRYDDAEAATVIEHVRQFMNAMATNGS